MAAPTHLRPRELTLRGLILGVLITSVFTAANVYLGLKVGLTFATSIPAAVISMAVLSVFRNSSILENNIVQTVASAAGTLSAIAFVLPGLVIVGWWTGFPFWQSFLICLSGGILGVLFTIPLRRALVTDSDLPYPEGVAAAEVLKVGSGMRDGEASRKTDAATSPASGAANASREGLMALILGAGASAGLALLGALQLVVIEFSRNFRLTPNVATGYNVGWSLALFGAGHLVGLSVGLAMLTGLIIAWGISIPILTNPDPAFSPDQLSEHVISVWRQVRFIGAGAIGVSAIWTLARLARPVATGLISTIAASRRAAQVDDRNLDLSPRWILALTAVCLAIAGGLSYHFARSTILAQHAVLLTCIAVPFVLLVGFLIAGVCGYMAGLIGASNSPISGVGIIGIVISATVLTAVIQPGPDLRSPLVAFALFITSIVFACATISNDNLQDLKTGQLVGASPWRQQVALIVGVLAGAAVIPPILNVLAEGPGFAGAPNVRSQNPLGAPQANIISALAQGIIGGTLDWKMIGIGAVVGIALITTDSLLKLTKRLSLPPLAVGIGIYLPMNVTFAVVLGAIVGTLYNRWIKKTAQPERAEQLGTLVASGLIVGESLFGVLTAGLIASLKSETPLAILKTPPSFGPFLGFLAFGGLILILYRWMMGKARARG
jgi:putative OPT family oligopeptide transporter